MKTDWFADDNGLSLSDINQLEKRLGKSMWDGVVHLGGISTGIWRPWPGKEGNQVREVLRLYPTREAWRADA